jgi:RecG-like helicase
VADDKGRVRCVWFNQPYLEKYIHVGDEVVLYGRVEVFNDRIQIVSPPRPWNKPGSPTNPRSSQTHPKPVRSPPSQRQRRRINRIRILSRFRLPPRMARQPRKSCQPSSFRQAIRTVR